MSAPYTITDIGGSIFVLYPDGTAYTPTPSGTADANCTISVCPVILSVYGYRPTLPGSIVLIALYGLCALIQVVMGWRYKTWGFMSAMLLGCADEILGYVGRILYYQNPWGQTGFLMQIGKLFSTTYTLHTRPHTNNAQCSSPWAPSFSAPQST